MQSSPFLGISISLVCFEAGRWIHRRSGCAALNPLLIGMLLSMLTLKVLHIDYEVFHIGGSMITFFVGPATVAMVVGLYKNIALLRRYWFAVLMGVLAGTLTSLATGFLFSRVFRFDDRLLVSLLPKSITTAIGVAVSAESGGYEAITIFAIIITGLVGAMLSPLIFRRLKVTHPVSRGIALGTASHAIGTATALELGEKEGAMSGLAIAISGIVSVVLIPLSIGWFL